MTTQTETELSGHILDIARKVKAAGVLSDEALARCVMGAGIAIASELVPKADMVTWLRDLADEFEQRPDDRRQPPLVN